MILRRLRWPVALAATATAVLAMSTAAAQPAPERPATSSNAKAAAPKAAGSTDQCDDGFGGVIIASGLPPTPCLTFPGSTRDRWVDSILPFDPIKQVVSKPKIAFTFPPLLVRGFVLVCLNSAPQLACPFETGLPDFTKFRYNFYGYFGTLWVRSPQGTEPRYGIFPTLHVAALAFGSVPITADVHIEQVLGSDGYRSPMHLQWVTGSNLKGHVIIPGYEQYGEPPQDGKTYQFYAAPNISGRVSIRVSNVRVDGVPVDVGPSCQTETNLSLTAASGYQVTGARPVEGEPGEYTPQGNSNLHGSVDVPAFHGCRNGNEDLSPLITGTVSGPGNHIDVHQTTNLAVTGCYFYPTDPNCDSIHPRTSPIRGLTRRQLSQLSPWLPGAAVTKLPK